MPRVLITGGAGFLGSHLCDLFLEKGFEVVCMDNLITGSTDNISHIRDRRFTFIHHDVTEYIYLSAPGVRAPLRVAGQSRRLLPVSDPDDEGRLPRHPQGARLAKEKKARFLLASPPKSTATRRSPAAGELSRQRRHHLYARRLRRGEALRRGADDGVSPAPRAQHADRAHLQHLRPRMRSTTGGRSRTFIRQAPRGAEHMTVSARGGRRAASAT